MILASDNHDRFTRNVRSHIVAWPSDLICTADDLPSTAKNGLALEGGDAVIDIPRRRNGEGFGQRRTVVVGIQNLGD